MKDKWYSQPVTPPCEASRLAALDRQNSLTKPQGSLGRMEAIAVELAAHQRTARPVLDRVAIIIFAADHGITGEGISAFPSEVTSQMLANYVQGGAAISVLARSLGAPLTVVDVGTYSDCQIPEVLHRKIARGTMNFVQGPAMRPEQADHALAAGAAIVEMMELRPQLLVLGEMGIGNTTSAAAVAAALLGRSPGDLVGAGTGVDGATIDRKAVLIEAALTRAGCNSRAVGATEALSLVGGFEIAALAGAMVRAAQLGISVLVDGFIASVAALCAVELNAEVRAWLIFAHRSHERGHKIVLDELGATPLLDLGMRLGEGSGAAIAVPLVRLACDLHNEMATFDEAAVAGRA
jgi:nicotinate-nucleotide--dimethylbenzimidazole phosphoribosyltransferase